MAKNLLKFSSIVDTDEMNKPSFLIVLTATRRWGICCTDNLFKELGKIGKAITMFLK